MAFTETQIQYFNYVLIGVAIVLVLRKVFFAIKPDDEGPREKTPEPLVFTTFIPRTLAKYDGLQDPRVLLAVNGKVYDVTAGKSFYGPEGPYKAFAGHDASRGLALNSFDENMVRSIDEPIDTLEDLTDAERTALFEWESHFSGKYILCGELVNETSKNK